VTSPTGQTVRFPRAEHGGLLLGLTLPQLILTGAALLLIAVAAFAGLGPAPALLLALSGGTLLATAFGRVDGHPAYRWLLLRGATELRRATRQDRFRARPERPRAAGTLGLPGTAASLRVIQRSAESGATFAAVHDPHARTLTAVLRVHGTAFALLDSGEQDRRVRGWSRALAGLCQGGRIARVQVLERTVPDSGDALAAYAEQHLSSEDSWPAQVYQDLVRSAAPASELHETYLAVSLDLVGLGRQVKQAGGGLRGATTLLAQETVSLESSLQAAGLTPNGWLDAGGIAAVTRSAYDPAAHHSDIVPDAHEPAPESGGPVAVDEAWDRLRSDSGFHAVYLVAQWPRVEVGADFLDPLVFTPGVRRALSIVAQPVGTDQALKEIRRAKTQHVTDAAQRARIGQIEDEALAAEYRDVLAREHDLVAGHGELRFIGLLAVTACTGDELDAACGQVETAAIQAMVDLRRLVGQQAEAFVAAALPLGRGLR
jgi:hypothetical protein